jgi:hypothetical protein
MQITGLQTAYATQMTNESGQSDWIIYNIPKEWTEKQVMTAIRMGRKFERLAFNDGIEFQRKIINNNKN